MPAGATYRGDDSHTSHHVDPALPYAPRPLSRGKRDRREVFVYYSPRNQRVVTVADAVTFAAALQLEFDSTIALYIERPRRLQISEKFVIDVSFLAITRSGEQRFILVLPNGRKTRSTGSVAGLPDTLELDEIAKRNGIYLSYVTEDHLLSQLPAMGEAFDLLPLVWSSERLANRASLAQQILNILGRVERFRLSDLIGATSATTHEVRATVAWLIHSGTLRLIDYVQGAPDAILERRHA